MSDTSNIGLIHNKDLPKDAIHIAIAQVRAGEELKAGDRVGFKEGNEVVFKDTNTIGIIDPFIEGKVAKDCLCYLFLFPNTVTSLTHNWEHPLFNRTPERIEVARKWLGDNCGDYYDYGYGDPDGRVKEYSNAENFIDMFSKGEFTWFAASGDDFSEYYNSNKDGTFRKQFWDNLEIVTGVLATKKQRDQEYFACSC